MKKYKYIFWDLDGTISDSGEGIINSVSYALEHMGTPVPGNEILRKFVGPPLAESFEKYFGYSDEKTDEAVIFFREYYQSKGIDENHIYAGIAELLQKLTDAGYICVVATAKPEPLARTILKRYGIDKLFLYIAGSTFDDTRTKKEAVIAYALETCGITDKSQVIMVGDRAHDCIGAKVNGLDCIGVLYGYGEREELEEAGVIAIAADIDELTGLLLNN
ncbi:MAG: phosphoglycolate phosphatase [Firmicutes bacterium HGW-Firmicutes-16]|nr:MAG: phosphoglycolate phosphatase [Firmicutes bacterium HGW-Firmicutes-16]